MFRFSPQLIQQRRVFIKETNCYKGTSFNPLHNDDIGHRDLNLAFDKDWKLSYQEYTLSSTRVQIKPDQFHTPSALLTISEVPVSQDTGMVALEVAHSHIYTEEWTRKDQSRGRNGRERTRQKRRQAPLRQGYHKTALVNLQKPTMFHLRKTFFQ